MSKKKKKSKKPAIKKPVKKKVLKVRKRRRKKGARFIAYRLLKEYKSRYKKYTSALPDARLILAQIRDAKEKVNVKNILDKVRVSRKKTVVIPQLPPEMLSEIDYFNLEDYIKYISDTPKSIYFISKIFPSTLKKEVRGGGNYSYNDLFADFVGYMNEVQSNSSNAAGDRYVPDLYLATITTNPPVQNEKGQWIAEIIYISQIDYGWDASNAANIPSPNIIAPAVTVPEPIKEEPAVEQAKEEPKTVSPEQEKQRTIELEKEKMQLELELEKEKNKKITGRLELIKELRSLGFSNEEIKEELKKL
jgi:hypothetical protein